MAWRGRRGRSLFLCGTGSTAARGAVDVRFALLPGYAGGVRAAPRSSAFITLPLAFRGSSVRKFTSLGTL